jgi:hypothetical protein
MHVAALAEPGLAAGLLEHELDHGIGQASLSSSTGQSKRK